MQQLLACLATLSLGFVCAVAQGQNSEIPSAPSAPLPSAPANTTKPTFTLPVATYERPVGKSPVKQKAPEDVKQMTPEEFCQLDTLKSITQQSIPKEVQGEMRNYEKLVFTEILDYWLRHERTRVSRERILAVYFTIKPDGSYTMPIITSSSGKGEYDRYAIDAIRGRDSYPPLPQGMTEPLKLCYRFGYNFRPGDGFEPNYDNWQKHETASKP